jgi:hypothetical protein
MLERMHDNISNDPNVEPYVLWRLKEDSTKTSGLPGLPVCIKNSFLNMTIDLSRLNFKLMVVFLVLLNNDNFLNILIHIHFILRFGMVMDFFLLVCVHSNLG